MKKIKYVKALIAVLALANLAALFLFQYRLPAFSQKEPVSESHAPETDSQSETEASGYTICFDEEPLVYDGASKLNLLEGVSLVSADGQPASDKIFAHIVTGDSINLKRIEYSADTDEGSVSASRELKLENYSGPSITLPQDFTEIDESRLDSVLDFLSDDDSFLAEDGYGNDITDAVSVTYTADANDPSRIHYTFTVTNLFNDTVSAQADVTLGHSGPFIILTQSRVTIERGDAFEPLAYVKNAADADGSSLFHQISIDGSVDTNTPGTYTLKYTVMNLNNEISLPKELIVTVK